VRSERTPWQSVMCAHSHVSRPSARSESSPPYSENSATRLARSPGLFRRVYDSNFLGNRLENTAIESPTKTFPPGRGCQLIEESAAEIGRATTLALPWDS
jgi:hypothetical protein